jgi:hypothetical protein
MRMPQVSERIKEAPAQALRGVFAGIGQLLLITDKLRNKTPAHDDSAQAAVPEPSPAPEQATEPAPASPQAAEPAAAEPAAPEPAAAEPERDPEKTGNVRVLTDQAPEPVTGEAPEPATAQTPEPVAAEPAAAEPVAAEPVAAGTAGLLPNYDSLTVASLRARLRNLSIDQVRELAEYEKAHAARAEVITMFERRVAKLEAGA